MKKKKRKTLLERYNEALHRELTYKENIQEINKVIDLWLMNDITTDKMLIRIMQITSKGD